MWKEVQENFGDLSIREQWILKNSRAGCSENCLLNPLRYIVGVTPRPVQYITGDELSAKRFMDKRIKLGLRCFEEGRGKLARAGANTKYDISFEDMDLVVSWPKNRMAFKQSGYEVILCDELSTWPGFSADMMRKRTDTYRYSHICGISSPDPQQKRGSDEDPIFIEFKGGDQRRWFMDDPGGGEPFVFEMGDSESVYGLKWPASCRDDNDDWDLDAVEREAYYVTPSGHRIDEADRWEVVRGGRWQPTAEGVEGRRSYHINSFYMPFKSGSFGHIARAFLEAKRRGPAGLKVFVYEYLAEEWYEDKQEAEDDAIYERETDYARGEWIGRTEWGINKWGEGMPSATLMTVDVQKGHMWWVVREWIEGGDSGLVDWGYAVSFEQIEEKANEHRVVRVLVDVGYAQRAMEVYEYALYHAAWPTKGHGNIDMPYRRQLIDPFEGKRGAGKENIVQYNFNTDIFKILLMDMVRGEGDRNWYVYKHIERDYVRQVASEHRVDGEWKCKPGHQDNHLWDCEVLQLLGATICGLFRNVVFGDIEENEEKDKKDVD
jgi:hypothetical protein